MSFLAPFQQGFLAELEKISEAKEAELPEWATPALMTAGGIGATGLGAHLGIKGKIPMAASAALMGGGMAVGSMGGMMLGLGKKNREKVRGEIRDPRLYSNLRGVLESREDRIAAHKHLRKDKEMGVLEAMHEGFTRGGEKKEAAKKPVKETRKGWLSPKSRKGTRPMKVSTLLKKEKDGTLGGYKLAELLTGFSKVAETLIPYEEGPSDQGAAQRKKEPGDIPSRDDVGSGRAKREDTRGFSATIHGPATIIAENAMTPGSR